jgi:hypothetical protein
MAAGPRKRVHRTRPTGQLARRLTWADVAASGHAAVVRPHTLLGQDELDISIPEASLRDQIARDAGGSAWTLAGDRTDPAGGGQVGQRAFAVHVLAQLR